jgi:glutathione-regulated potassium-efflux system ancillary protein KefG
MMRKVLILFAHPAFEKSRVNRALATAAGDLEGVTFQDLYPDKEFDGRPDKG